MTPPVRGVRHAQLLAAGASILVATLLAYLPAIRGGFVWDDDHYVTSVGLRSWHGLWLIWTKPGATQQYFPLLHTSFWIEYHLWGSSPLGYHLANVIEHAIAACLLGLFLRRLSIPGSYLAALVFALHPVGVESVAWISEQKNTLSAVFFIASAIAYLRFDQERKLGLYAGATCLFALALASKTTTAPLPAALLVVLWWKRGDLTWRRDVFPLIPWFVSGASAGLFSAWVEHSLIGANGAAFQARVMERCVVAGHLVCFYFAKLFWPTHLNFVYPRWNVDTLSASQWLYPATAAIIVATFWYIRRTSRAPLAASLYFIGLLFPVLGFLNVYWFIYSFAADHFQYLAQIGIITLVAAGWGNWRARQPGPLLITSAAVITGLLGILTWQHCRVYANIETLYRTTLAENPASWLVQNNLGVLLRESGRVPEAVEHLAEAVRLRPDAVSHYNLGVAYADEGRNADAVVQYEAALNVEPNYPGVHYDLGRALAAMGRLQEAIGHYREALRLNLSLPEVHISLGNALADAGQRTEAIQHYVESVELQPTNPEAHYYWGNLLLNAGDFNGAKSQFENALRAKPSYPEARYDLGVALASLGQNMDAIAQYEEAIRLRPDYPEAEGNLGAALAGSGKPEAAITHYQRALRLRPNDSNAHYNLGLALQDLGRTDQAAREFAEAARLKASP